MDNWIVKNKHLVLKQGKFLTVEYHHLQLPNGMEIEDWSWLITPDFVNGVVVDEAGQFVVFKQGKYAYEGDSIAPVGGIIEPNEDPLEAAKREALEETGYAANEWHSLGQWVTDANRGVGTAYAFLALGAKKIQERNADDLEAQELLLLSRAELEKALWSGEVKVLSWQNSFLMALMMLDKQK
jgi:ADP-ribose pyrophosphatase